MRFEKKGKLAPSFIGPFEILDRVGALAYRVAFPPNLDGVRNFFHVSMLRKYISNPSHVLSLEPLQLTPHMTYEERPIRILDRQERRLRNKSIPMIKVRWQNHSDEEATLEAEADIRTRYPELFVHMVALRVTDDSSLWEVVEVFLSEKVGLGSVWRGIRSRHFVKGVKLDRG
ncbi:uncharacterized protein [Henckelia pumila]|uniref:uncharacterized protein n=1 Tax=Henckelia pumila TaxID=405737 RepID=UPI003C6E08FF